MTIETLCTGSIATVQEAANTKDSMGSNQPGYADTSRTLEFFLQSENVTELTEFNVRSLRTIYRAFFASNPNLDQTNRLKVTQWMGETLSTPRYLRVTEVDREGSPHDTQLWMAVLYEDVLNQS